MTFLLLFLAYAIVLTTALGRAGHRSRVVSGSAAPRARPERVLIVGATGGTGRRLVAQALERGYVVTALARNPAKMALTHPRLTVMPGNVLDERSVEAAVRGQDAVLCALGHRRFLRPTRILSDGTRNILSAMQLHDVRRLVCETSLGIGDSAGRMGLWYTLFVIPVILQFYFWDKTRQERIVAMSGIEWVIVRPGALTDGERGGRCRHGREVGSFLLTRRVSRADVADFMLDQLESDAYLRAAPGLCW